MTYSFDSPRGVEEQFRAIADYQIGEALDELDRPESEREDIVHDVRLRCKKLRGLIRLVRPAFDDYKDENEAFKQVAHLFGPLRDAKVMQDTYDLLMEGFEEQVDRTAFSDIRRELTRRRKELLDDTAWDDCEAEARERLERARTRASKWTLEAEGWDALSGGLAKTYKRACKAMAKARKEPSGENHHEWRKRTKYHWYHTRLLKHSFPQHLKPRAETVHDLSNLLGDHHDIHVFLETIEADPAAFCDGETLALLQAMARKRSEQLERRSADLGVRLFADDPKTLVSRWSAWWDAWTTEEARPHAA